MADPKTGQETKVDPAQSQTGQASAPANEKKTEDYEAKYKELQSQQQKTAEELASTKELVRAIEPHVDWGAVRGQGAGGQDTGSEADETLVTSKEVAAQLRQVEERNQNAILALSFRSAHPELAEYEDTLIVPQLLRIRKKYPHESKERILERAAEWTTKFLEGVQNKALTAKQQADAKVKAEEDAMSGFESAGATSPEEESPPETTEEYIERRNREKAEMGQPPKTG